MNIADLFDEDTARHGENLPITRLPTPRRKDSTGYGWWVKGLTYEQRLDLMVQVLTDEATALLYDSLGDESAYPFADVFQPLLAHVEAIRNRLKAQNSPKINAY